MNSTKVGSVRLSSLFKILCVMLILCPAHSAIFLKNEAVQAENSAKLESRSDQDAQKQPHNEGQNLGIGALGRIEPRSRVIRLSHDLGMEGARVEKLLVEEGQEVKAGDVVAIFSEHDRRVLQVAMAQARAESLKAKTKSIEAELEDAASTFKRNESLLKKSNVSEAIFDASKARLQKAKADLAVNMQDITAAEAELKYNQQRILQAKLVAPITGTIVKIYTRPGESVSDNRVMDIANLSELDAVAEVYENDMPRVKAGQKAEILLSGNPHKFQGEVRELGFFVRKNDMNNTDPLADRDNRIIEVRLSLQGEAISQLRHQIYRQVQIKIVP